MGAVLTGFAIIGVIVAAGYLSARLRIGGPDAGTVLNRVGFFAASPALLFTVLATSDVARLVQAPLVVAAACALAAGAVFVVANRWWLRLPAPEATVGTVASGYVNANNIGLPVAVYVLGDPTVVVPVILLQLLVLAPITLLVLDATTSGRTSWRLVVSQPVRNPIILGSFAGAVVSLTGWAPPVTVMAPLEILGGAAIPMILLAFGMSLHGSRPLRRGQPRAAIAVASATKLVVMPVVAFLVARYVLGLDPAAVASAVTLAALPTAQNVYNYAVRFGRGEILARDTVLVTTVGAPVVLVVVALLLA
ncbi:AEC family transporter [Cellulosimicrobium arenosum]|uniref:AEC family transporter n=1 Tax=Cellulosimicrobium arenosum TaxID=2708133 RepID=A0A927IZ50_9MICO|nr:AEC family transporter [Cellulosimicrobium arenosum]MBD8078069.1 AEC family transporter [Cellulosimicrobium arenosum]